MIRFSRSLRPRARQETSGRHAWVHAGSALILVGCSQPGPPGPSSSATPAFSETPASSVPAPGPAPDVVPPGSAGEPYAASRTYLEQGGATQQAWMLCDGLDTGRLFVVGLPDAKGQVTIASFDKANAATPTLQILLLGPPDPGAGQVYWPLTAAGQSAGALHAFNPGALDQPTDALTPTFTSVQLGPLQTGCRWLGRTRLMGFTARRSLLVTTAPDGSLEYQTFDFSDAASAKPMPPNGAQRSTRPSLDVKGGQETGGGFTFANKGYSYQLSAGPAGAQVVVGQGGKTISTEPLIAWTIAPKP